MLNPTDLTPLPKPFTVCPSPFNLTQGCISDDHELCLGPIGVHGLFTANTAVARCDLLLALGCRFDERCACKAFEMWDSPRPVVHVDIAPQQRMSGSPKNTISCSVEADCEDFVGVLLQHLYGFIEDRRNKFTGAWNVANDDSVLLVPDVYLATFLSAHLRRALLAVYYTMQHLYGFIEDRRNKFTGA
jgi:TPP-dependent trihydroxycyclohexane-1,2-dione (THcHDO) dehydratase